MDLPNDCETSRRFVCSSTLDDDGPRLGPALGQVVALAPGVAQGVETLNLRHRDPEHGIKYKTINGRSRLLAILWLAFIASL